MTSPVGVIGLAYDGYDLQRADLNVMFAITEGLDDLPQVRGIDDIIPFRSGRLPSARIADRRPIVLTGWIAGAAPAPEASYRAYLDGLKRILDPTRTAATLAATLEDGSLRRIMAVPRNMVGGSMIGHEFRPLSIELEALDPFWLGAYGTATLDTGLLLDDGLYLDSGAEVAVIPTSLSHALSLDTQGSADVEHVRVRFVGPSSGAPGIEVDTPDGIVGFAMSTALASGQELVVDNYTRTATISAVSQRSAMTLKAANRHGEYVRLVPRLNTIRLLGAPALVRLFFNPTYL